MSRSVLRVFLKSGNVTDFVLSLAEASQVLDAWRVGTIKGIFGGTMTDGVQYGVRAEDISVLVILPHEEPKPPHPRQQAIPPMGTLQFPARA